MISENYSKEPNLPLNMSNGRTAVVIFGSNHIMQLDDKPGVLFWTCPLSIDGDGHPECYHPNGSPPGLDYTANAGSPGNWWGIATDSSGKPYIQKSTDIAPGFYVSCTALMDGALPASNPAKYVHAGAVPYVVLPSKPKFDSKQTLGDLLMCFNNATGMFTWAIYADIGPANRLGEGSIALADSLGVPSNCKSGGTSKETIAMIYFPGSKIGWPRQSTELAQAAYKLFEGWGGYASCKAGLPQFNWDQFPPIGGEPSQIAMTVTVPSGTKVNSVTGAAGSDITVSAPPNVSVTVTNS